MSVQVRKTSIAILIIVLAICLFFILKSLKKPAEKEAIDQLLPVVDVVVAETEAFQLYVEVNGTVRPARETTLTAQVSGQVVEVTNAMLEGNRFEKGELLLSLEEVDYQAALSLREAEFAQAESAYEQELALREQALRDWKRAGREGEPSTLAGRLPQIKQAKALLQSAKDAVALAQKNILRTKIKAPYAGRVLERTVDLGQFVTAGVTTLGQIYDDQNLEVGLSLSNQEFRRLGIPFNYERKEGDLPEPTVTFTSTMPGEHLQWSGKVDRVAARIDEETRLIEVVAVIDNEAESDQRLPLSGEFLSARINGDVLPEVMIVPSLALVGLAEVRVVDDENILRKRSVQIAQVIEDRVVIAGGLERGDLVSVTPLDYNLSEMEVEISKED